MNIRQSHATLSMAIPPVAIVAAMVLAQGIGTGFIGVWIEPDASPFVIFTALVLCMVIALISLAVRRQFPTVWTRDGVLALMGMNVVTAGAWILFYTSVTLIPPSAATVLEAGIGPVVMTAIGFLGWTQAASRNEAITSIVITVLVIATTLYIFLDSDGAPLDQIVGVIFALAAGFFSVFNIIFSRRCVRVGVTPMVINAFRFPLAILVSGVLCILAPVPAGIHPWLDPSIYVIALCAITIPMLALQFGISHAPAFWSSILLACLPAIVFTTESLLSGTTDLPLLVLTLAVVVTALVGAIVQHIRRHSDAIPVGPGVSG